MKKIWLVAQREFLENVATKGFWIGLLLFPVLLAASVVLPRLLDRARSVRAYAIVDRSGWLLDAARPLLNDTARIRGRFVLRDLAPADTVAAELARRVGRGDLFAVFEIGTDPLAGNDGFRYTSKNLADDDLPDWVTATLGEVVRARKLEREQIAPATAQWIAAPVRFETHLVNAQGEAAEARSTDRMRQFAPIIFVYILWIAIFSISQMLMTNMIEEKSNRVVEVLLSSVSPVELMGGKILGIAITGLTIIISWVISLVVGMRVLPRLLGAPPSFDLSGLAGDPLMLTMFVVYFVLGYLFYAALLVAIGAVCNTLKDAQNLMSPIILLLMLPLVAMMPIARDPNGPLAQTLSWIPPFTPFVMLNRMAGPPTAAEFAGTTVLLVLAIAGALWAAAKVFRVGILMTGKAPTLKEVVRWVRQPV